MPETTSGHPGATTPDRSPTASRAAHDTPRGVPPAPAAAAPRRRGALAVRVLVPALTLALAALLLLSTSIGTIGVSPADAFRIILGHLVPGMPWMSDGSLTTVQDNAVWQFRLPRVLLAALTGASLALAGALIQAVVHNSLAEPYILGVSAGAGVGAVSFIVLGIGISSLGIGASAFVGALLATGAVYFLARKNGRIAPQRLILAGVALGSLFSAVTSYLTITTDAQNVFSIMFFLLGSVSAATMGHLALPASALLAVGVLTAFRARALNALLVGDDAAASLGVNVNRLRTAVLVAAALLTGSVVAVSGGIGFVGLVIPHIARIVVGSDHRKMLPVAVLAGAVFLAGSDLLARTLAAPSEIPLGVLTALVGAPFFLWLLRRDRAESVGMSR
ncbi:FecCD family ABC transporter permease [Streptomonospora nanhaiensis]|uniref:Iron complex transport system permease protein n=1 Tax=Streptomonospora nanhaiensis TaxID=1323731 RepID=A0A853BKR3_9ACTN|nr:iron ABC transporter permease [Streptomonospora nanhaiensis]MBV2364173.1 iron ABC transporter permease [Streptomonospora nanhaiensis]MBX9386707.1 iron ABC transporter permease [Streptomonospora nanhaiensis]NYI95126.1 iron complex transport system permease protein [Streptomonospora nanhaiensis]